MSTPLRTVRDELRRQGLLLHADARLPSVATIVAGEPVRGSWWGHPTGHAIHAVLEALDDADDATSVKLVNGKLTLVHLELWPALARVGLARPEGKLTQKAAKLLAFVKEHCSARTATLPAGTDRAVASELEKRLLCHTSQVHTESGAHARVLVPWDAWAREWGVTPMKSLEAAQERFAAVAERWRALAPVRFPWDQTL